MVYYDYRFLLISIPLSTMNDKNEAFGADEKEVPAVDVDAAEELAELSEEVAEKQEEVAGKVIELTDDDVEELKKAA